MTIIIVVILISILPIYFYQAMLVNTQDKYRNQLITTQRNHLPIIIPSYSYPYDLNMVIKDNTVCIYFNKICSFNLPPQSIKILSAKNFFAQDYISYTNYLKAQPINQTIGVTLTTKTKDIIEEMRWLPINIKPSLSTGYQHLSVKGILFIVLKPKASQRQLKLYAAPEYLYPLYRITKLSWLANNDVNLKNSKSNLTFNLPDGRMVIAVVI